MPKVIADLQKNILRVSKELLLRNGYDELAIRDVAERCGIAVGTVYNYFPSKEMLAASIMLEDWLKALEKMRAACAEASTVRGGLTALYDEIAAFSSVYQFIWRQYTFTSSAQQTYIVRHRQLVGQLVGLISSLLTRFGYREDACVCVFFAESILTYSGDEALEWTDLLNIFDRTLTNKGDLTHV